VHLVDPSRKESHVLAATAKEDDRVIYAEIKRGDITVHNERVIHGSGPNTSKGWRRAYVLAFRQVIIQSTYNKALRLFIGTLHVLKRKGQWGLRIHITILKVGMSFTNIISSFNTTLQFCVRNWRMLNFSKQPESH